MSDSSESVDQSDTENNHDCRANKRLQTKVFKLETELKSLKPLVFAEAKEFVREQSRKILKAITKKHKQLIQEHLEYRDDT